MTFLILGIVVSFNFIVILKKWQLKRYFDTIVDCSLLTVICFLFSGTFSALVTGAIASMCVSVWLYFNPIFMKQFIPTDDEDDDYEDDDDDF